MAFYYFEARHACSSDGKYHIWNGQFAPFYTGRYYSKVHCKYQIGNAKTVVCFFLVHSVLEFQTYPTSQTIVRAQHFCYVNRTLAHYHQEQRRNANYYPSGSTCGTRGSSRSWEPQTFIQYNSTWSTHFTKIYAARSYGMGKWVSSSLSTKELGKVEFCPHSFIPPSLMVSSNSCEARNWDATC